MHDVSPDQLVRTRSEAQVRRLSQDVPAVQPGEADARGPTDKAREKRITMEIVVDAYTENERAMGWYYYLEGMLQFPFRARCIKHRAVSPLRPGDEVEVIRMAPEEECEHEMLVMIQWERRTLTVPLSQLEGIKANTKTLQAIGDWRYWVRKRYEF
jgi:hypothetical protein